MSRPRRAASATLVSIVVPLFALSLALSLAGACAERLHTVGDACLKGDDCLSGICLAQACAAAPTIDDVDAEGSSDAAPIDAAIEAAPPPVPDAANDAAATNPDDASMPPPPPTPDAGDDRDGGDGGATDAGRADAGDGSAGT